MYFAAVPLYFYRNAVKFQWIICQAPVQCVRFPALLHSSTPHPYQPSPARGRRQSLDALVSKMGSKIEGCENPYVFISHGDCLEDAKYVSAQVKSLYGIKTELIENIGPVIGSHSGPGTVALFFVGQSRTEKKAL